MLFPWVEEEKAALEARCQELGRKADDFALQQFLNLLITFRRILLQDAAVLYTQYPDWPMWNFSPFNIALFRSFALTSAEVISSAEECSRANLAAIPRHVAESFRGTATTVHIQQEAQRLESREMFSALSQQMDFLLSTVTTLVGPKARRQDIAKLLARTEPPLKPLPCSGSHILPSSGTSPPRVTQPLVVSPSHVPPTPSAMQSENSHSSAANPSPSFQTTSTNHLLSSDAALATIQRKAMQALEARYGQHRVANHVWNWADNTWLPSYQRVEIASIQSLRELWEELEVGIDGHLSISELEDGWKAKWRHGDRGASTDLSRRRRLVSLVKDISQKQDWTNKQALDFLSASFPISRTSSDERTRSVRSFLEAIPQKGTFRAYILDKCSAEHKT
ncbi:hypothetical protein F5878DRAFT_207623 [Lentinula raphanica]|uniref:Transcription activator GCR1-like domain-containing protein n=1 Tax=Lentinula raphanica TaxID=153919 RepID=A0AA38UK99_9AGAR|nr:hypothetical protein F5878DRAFT_207623 [Lentinula raphanica]